MMERITSVNSSEVGVYERAIADGDDDGLDEDDERRWVFVDVVAMVILVGRVMISLGKLGWCLNE